MPASGGSQAFEGVFFFRCDTSGSVSDSFRDIYRIYRAFELVLSDVCVCQSSEAIGVSLKWEEFPSTTIAPSIFINYQLNWAIFWPLGWQEKSKTRIRLAPFLCYRGGQLVSLKRKSLGWRKEGYEVSDSPTGHPASTHFSAPAPASRTFTHRPTPLSTPTHPFSALSTQPSCLLLACVYFTQALHVMLVTYRVFFFHWYPPKKLMYGKPW